MTVLIACEPVAEGSQEVRVLLVQAADGVVLLPAWSSRELLVATCGPEQPWIEVPLGEVAALRVQAGAAAVVLDADVAGAAP